MIIAQLSDTHLSLDAPQRFEDFKACVAHINGLAEPPDLVIHSGDVVHNALPEEYEAAKAIMQPLKMPVAVIPGNRDRRDVLCESMGQWCPVKAGAGASYLQYAIEIAGVRAICLDTLSLDSNKGRLCDVRLAQAQELLHEDQATPTVIFMHHPPFEVAASREPFQFETREAADKLLAMIKAASNVVGLFCGHVHRPGARMIGQVSATTLTSIALDLRVGHNPAKSDLRPRYDLHTIGADGSVVSQTMSVEGAAREETMAS